MEKERDIENQKKIERGDIEIGKPEKGTPGYDVREEEIINNEIAKSSFYNFTQNPQLESLIRH